MFNPIEYIQKMVARSQLKKNRADFYYDLASSLEDKIPVFTIIRKFKLRAKERGDASALIYNDMLKELSTGTLTDALKNIAPSNELLMIDALQSTGDATMAEGLKFLSGTVEKTDAMLAASKKAIMYPLIMIIVFSVMLAGYSFKIVPILADLLDPSRWPTMGRLLYTISQLVVNYGLVIAASFIITLIVFLTSLGRWSGGIRDFFDKGMPYSLYRDYSGAMLIVSLSCLLRTGVSLRSSLIKSMEFSSPWMRYHLMKIIKNLSQSNDSSFGVAFKTGVLNEYLEDRVQDASERRNPVQSFVKIGTSSIDRVIRTIEKSAAKLSTAILLFCGVLLLIMMAGFFSTTMELRQGISRPNL